MMLLVRCAPILGCTRHSLSPQQAAGADTGGFGYTSAIIAEAIADARPHELRCFRPFL